MNKLTKRVLAFMLMVCMLAAMVPAVVSAETTADPYVIDFEIDTNENLVWNDGEVSYTFAGTNFAHAQTDSGNAGWLSAFNDYYEDEKINFSFPHTVITAEDAEADKTLTTHVGKIADAVTYKSSVKNENQFGSYMYNATSTTTSNTLDWTGLKIGAASDKYNTSGTGWNAMILRAPDVGTYKVTLEYTQYVSAGSKAKVFLLPYTAEMKAQVASDPTAWNTYITSIVTAGEDADSYKGTFSSWIQTGSPVPGQIANLGELSVGIEVDEYLMVISQNARKYDYIQNVTFTPVAEEEEIVGAEEAVNVQYNMSGVVSSAKNAATEDGLADINAAADNWDYLGHTSPGTQQSLGKTYFTLYGTGSGWSTAFKISSPGTGKFAMSMSYHDGSDSKTQAWTKMYIAEYTDGMTFTDAIADANLVGTHQPASTTASTSVHDSDTIGFYTFDAGKTYVLVLAQDTTYAFDKKFDTNNDGTIDVNQTNNLYLHGFTANKAAVTGTAVAKAYIGSTSYSTVAAAAAAAKEGDTITLAKDFTGNIDPKESGVSIDLNGYTWTVTSVDTYTASENVIDSAGTGKLVTKSLNLYNKSKSLPLLSGDKTYTLANYELTVDTVTEPSPINTAATRFWFKLDLLDDAYLDMIADGKTGLTIGVELDWGQDAPPVYTFDQGAGEEAFAADWADAYKKNKNVWLWVDIVGVDTLESNLKVTPVLKVSDSTLWNGSIPYTVGG